jgi:hypothetical protein
MCTGVAVLIMCWCADVLMCWCVVAMRHLYAGMLGRCCPVLGDMLLSHWMTPGHNPQHRIHHNQVSLARPPPSRH